MVWIVLKTEMPGHAPPVCRFPVQNGLHGGMVVAYMLSREVNMAMVMPRVHDKITRIILAGM